MSSFAPLFPVAKIPFPFRSTREPTLNIDRRSDEKIPSRLRFDPDMGWFCAGGICAIVGVCGGGSFAIVGGGSEYWISLSGSPVCPCCLPFSIGEGLEQLSPIVDGCFSRGSAALRKSKVKSLQSFSVSMRGCYGRGDNPVAV